ANELTDEPDVRKAGYVDVARFGAGRIFGQVVGEGVEAVWLAEVYVPFFHHVPGHLSGLEPVKVWRGVIRQLRLPPDPQGLPPDLSHKIATTRERARVRLVRLVDKPSQRLEQCRLGASVDRLRLLPREEQLVELSHKPLPDIAEKHDPIVFG